MVASSYYLWISKARIGLTLPPKMKYLNQENEAILSSLEKFIFNPIKCQISSHAIVVVVCALCNQHNAYMHSVTNAQCHGWHNAFFVH